MQTPTNLGARLASAKQFVKKGGRVIDVGTDHAYLPIALIREGISSAALACDINEGPIASARENIAAAGLEDLISIGTIGLIKAVNTFCPERNIKLATYASRCIENEILMHLRKCASLRNEVSIDEPLNTDWDGNELLLSDILGSDGDEVGRGIEQEDEHFLLHRFVDELPPREKQIMEMRFGLGGYNEYTQKQVADTLGISQSYISRLEKRIIVKLKKQIEKAV